MSFLVKLFSMYWDTKKNVKLVFLGLEPRTHLQELVMGNIRLRTFDLGVHEITRKIWTDYLGFVERLVFLVDRERVGLA